MKKLTLLTLLVVYVSCAAHSVLANPTDTFQITGAVVKPGAWSVARLRQEMPADIQAVTYTLKGKSHTAHIVPLWTLLQAAGPRFNPKIKNHALQFVVVVTGQDGYTADFSLAELSPDFGHRRVWVALDQDAKPLTEDAGPVQLLAPDDGKPARWVHAVAAVTLVDMAQHDQPGRG